MNIRNMIRTLLLFACVFSGLVFTGCVTETRRGNAPFAITTGSSNANYAVDDIRWTPVVTSSGGRLSDNNSDTIKRSTQPDNQQQQKSKQKQNPADGGRTAYTEKTTYTNAAIAPLGTLPWNGISLPLIDPRGEYIALQSGAPVPWEILLGEAGAGPLPYSMITIYRIEIQEEANRPILTEQHWLENAGILGRMADESGFLIESPRPDGNRWIGKVSWVTGQIEWLVRGLGVNAFGVLTKDGRLAWCWREIDDPDFELIVQGDNEVYTVPAEEGSWLMPVWSGDGNTLFAFRLQNDDTFGIFALDPSTQLRLRTPFASRQLIENGIAADAYDALAAIQQPTSPDGSARLLFFHPGLDFKRVCMFDPYRDGITYYKSKRGGGGWHTADSLVLATDKRVYYQEMNSGKPPMEILTGTYLPIPTTPPDRPYLLVSPSSYRSDQLNLYLMQLISSDARVINNVSEGTR